MTILERDPCEPVEQRRDGCQCGYPDEPGFCPGPANCPRVMLSVIDDVRNELNGCVRYLEMREGS